MRKYPALVLKPSVSFTEKITFRLPPRTKHIFDNANENGYQVAKGLRDFAVEWAEELAKEHPEFTDGIDEE